MRRSASAGHGIGVTPPRARICRDDPDLSARRPLGDPFRRRAIDIKTLAMVAMGSGYRPTMRTNLPKHWLPRARHTHVAVDDAIEQGELFMNLVRELNVQRGDVALAAPIGTGGTGRGRGNGRLPKRRPVRPRDTPRGRTAHSRGNSATPRRTPAVHRARARRGAPQRAGNGGDHAPRADGAIHPLMAAQTPAERRQRQSPQSGDQKVPADDVDPRACELPGVGTNRQDLGGGESARTHPDDQHQFRTRLRRRDPSKHGKHERAQPGGASPGTMSMRPEWKNDHRACAFAANRPSRTTAGRVRFGQQ